MTWNATISVEGVRYSVPHELIDTRVWARFHGDELIVTAINDEGGAYEAARHSRGKPGAPVIDDGHYPPREDKQADRTPRHPHRKRPPERSRLRVPNRGPTR